MQAALKRKMENLEFTDEEIREQLEALGYFDVSQSRLRQFRRDLQRLVEHDRSSGSSSWFTEITSPSTNSDASPASQQQAMKPSLSRYQPHVKVSPRTTHVPRFSPRKMTDLSSPADHEISSDGGFSPATRVKTVETSYGRDEQEGAGPSSPWRRYDTHTTSGGTDYNGQTATLLRRYDDHSTEERDEEPRSPWRQRAAEPQSPWRHLDIREVDSTSPGRRYQDDDVMDESQRDVMSFSRRDDVTEQTQDSPTDTVSPTPQLSSDKRRIIRRRKVMRKQTDGSSAVFDESLVADSENGQSFRMHDVSLDDMNVHYNRVHLPPTLPPRPHTARTSSKKSPDQESIREPLPSWIRPNTSHPHTRNLRKTDPVNRYHQYKDSWNAIKAPGEKSHSGLRWDVRAQMLYKDEPHVKPQRVFVPNTYIVPTSKKRSALRWEVRHAMENGLPVPSTFTVI